MDWKDLESFSFGDSPALADALAALVLSGKKTATCWAVRDGLKSVAIGKPMVVLSGAGMPLAVIETIELAQCRFNEVDERFAHDEGENDQSLAAWQNEHRKYFVRNGGFTDDMMLYCERFRLVKIIEDLT